MPSKTPPKMTLAAPMTTTPGPLGDYEGGRTVSFKLRECGYIGIQRLVQSGQTGYQSLEEFCNDAVLRRLAELQDAGDCDDPWFELAVMRLRQERDEHQMKHFDEEVTRFHHGIAIQIATLVKQVDGAAITALINQRWWQASQLTNAYWRARWQQVFKDCDAVRSSVSTLKGAGHVFDADLCAYLGL